MKRLMPAKSSLLDSIPASVIKTFAETIAVLITRLLTLSFAEEKFPEKYKHASVTPLLKKEGLDSDSFGSSRLISNLHTISKIVERVSMSRLVDHIRHSPNFNRFQSAYRCGHSTETALLRFLNDVYCAADSGSRPMLLQLDLPAAFDTIDTSTLLRRLRYTFGVSGPALSWIASRTSSAESNQSASVRSSHRPQLVSTASHKDPCSVHVCSRCTCHQ